MFMGVLSQFDTKLCGLLLSALVVSGCHPYLDIGFMVWSRWLYKVICNQCIQMRGDGLLFLVPRVCCACRVNDGLITCRNIQRVLM